MRIDRAILEAIPALLTLLALAGPAAAQAPGFSTGDWKELETENFLFLYPEEVAAWAIPMAERMEAVREAVRALVGYAPEDRVTVLVDDPSNVSNGSMNPGPLLFMWPTPPSPRSVIGENRGWSEMLAVHEFAHAAHLTRPSRNRWERLRMSFMPVPTTRIMLRTPRWAVEGYATYLEGVLTGSGRPHGAWRPAVLRTWALEGQLPSYGQMSGSGTFFGGSMAYLAGSAFLEWLVAREGGDEAVLPNVWARFTARQTRSFDGAFTGVFGAPPSELYGLFAVDVTENALAVRDAVEAAGGVVDGELFQRLSWHTGDPAVSPDGDRVAVVLRSREGPSRVVVMGTTPDTMTTAMRERVEEIFERDPEDVRPVERRPRAQRARATLWPTAGMPYDAPAWMPDGEGLLVVRADFVENARARNDLFLWRWESGELRRITHGQAIREADPAPDGTWAAGLRCLHARCDIVRIDLEDGSVRVLAAGDPLTPWFRPRVSPDGRSIVASRQLEGRWRLVMMDADGSHMRYADREDGADRFDADFLPGGERLVATSTRGGIHNLEVLDIRGGGVRTLTRVLSAAVAPSPMPDGDVFFLSLQSRGWDLRRIGTDGEAPPVAIDPLLTPAAARGVAAVDTLPVAPVGPARDYGIGPRFRSFAPMADLAANAYAVGAVVNGTDPIGMLSWQLRGAYGERDAFRGGAADVVWRGLKPDLRLGAFAAGGPVPSVAAVPQADGALLDQAYYGGLASVTARRARTGLAQRAVVGGSMGVLPGEGDRALAWAEVADVRLRTRGRLRLTRQVMLHGAVGRTDGLEWTRWKGAASLELASPDNGIGVSGMFGRTDAPAGSVEAFSIGGTGGVLLDDALLSQQLAMPALPVGFLRGHEFWTARASVGGEPVKLFYWMGDARGDAIDRYQVLGVEAIASTPAIHYVRLPAMQVRAGVGRLLDDPLENEWRGWAVLRFVP